ncbi:MAG: hypothetical protein GC155_17775 [Alphaproteobacteria bacterium]|nr:hypothetical protein [Alphaproteobacteria bacterium]
MSFKLTVLAAASVAALALAGCQKEEAPAAPAAAPADTMATTPPPADATPATPPADATTPPPADATTPPADTAPATPAPN